MSKKERQIFAENIRKRSRELARYPTKNSVTIDSHPGREIVLTPFDAVVATNVLFLYVFYPMIVSVNFASMNCEALSSRVNNNPRQIIMSKTG